MRKLLALLFLVATTATVFAQGTIRGTLIDGDTQEPLIGGTVRIEGSGAGAITDFDGSYSIQVPAGTYTVVHTYIGYQDKKVSDVVVTEGAVNALGNVALGMGGEGAEIDAVVVTAYTQKNNEEGLLNYQMNSAKIVDAVSAQSISKSGDSDVAAVVKRVPGVTVEGGKYVYVRGLGDRYSKSIVNGMEIPGLDPERNTVQMDIFSSNIIDNIIVYKTFSPDLSGDFTGGMVDVVTKDFPQEKYLTASIGAGYNSATTFNEDYIDYDFTVTDLLGFGKSSREIPFSKDLNPNQSTRSVLTNATEALNKKTAVTQNADNFLNQSLSFAYGNQIDIKDNALGFTAAVNYKKDHNFKPNWQRNDIGYLNQVVDDQVSQYRRGLVGSQDGMLNGIFNTAYKFGTGKVGLKLMHTRTGEGSVAVREKEDLSNNQFFDENIVDYFQRTITNGVLSTDLYFGDDQDIEFDAAVAYTKSGIDNPERTNIEMFKQPNGDYSFASNSRFQKEWRELGENNVNGKANIQLPFLKARDYESTVKFGLASNYKTRNFEPVVIKVAPSNPFDGSLTSLPNNDLDYILQNVAQANGNSYSPEGYIINDVKVDLVNKFDADMMVNAGYAMTDYKINDKFQFIGGLRTEQAIMNYTSFDDSTGSIVSTDTETLNEIQLLPSANFVFEPKDYMKARASYNRTLARPSFKEKSNANIFDAILGQFFIGNIDLVETTIDNYDLRWEYYFDNKEMVSISPFYKSFKNPIEMTFITEDQIKPVNKEDANLLGVEAEIRKDFGFVNEAWEKVAFNGNFTFVQSAIDFAPNERLKYGNDVPADRELVGQAPFSINASVGYTGGEENGITANLGYNVKGKTLNIAGASTTSYDVFEDPFHNLDFKVSKKFNDKFGSKISLSAKNLLNDNVDYFYGFDGNRLGNYQSYDVGQSYSIGYSLDLSK